MNHVHVLSRRMVLPEAVTSLPPEAEGTIDLTPWDLSMIALEYNQKGIVLPKPPTTVGEGHLASSLARALGRFYPYAGRLSVALAPRSDGDGEKGGEGIVISLHCSMKGAEFVHAVAPGVTVADITTPLYTPRVVRCFFPLHGLHGVDAAAGSLPLLAAQVTELDDGIFVAMSLNHVVADGAALSNLFNTWSEISRGGGSDGAISLPLPVHRRWFLAGCPVPVPLPFGKLEDIAVNRHPSSAIEEGFLNFSAEMVKKLKAKANAETSGANNTAISSLQALLAHLWMAVCRARRLSTDHRTAYVMAVGCRGRVDGLPAAYSGNAVARAEAVSTAGEILERGLGWTATLLNRAVASLDATSERDRHVAWPEKPFFSRVPARPTATAMMVTGGSPRFDVYGNDFGWGRPVGVRSGPANKMDGTATAFEGRDGGGSMALAVCLPPEVLARLVADEEFMAAVCAATP